MHTTLSTKRLKIPRILPKFNWLKLLKLSQWIFLGSLTRSITNEILIWITRSLFFVSSVTSSRLHSSVYASRRILAASIQAASCYCQQMHQPQRQLRSVRVIWRRPECTPELCELHWLTRRASCHHCSEARNLCRSWYQSLSTKQSNSRTIHCMLSKSYIVAIYGSGILR